MLRDALRRGALRLDASYTEELVRLHRRRGGPPSPTAVVTIPPSAPVGSSRVAVVAHVYYPELLDQIRASVGSIRPRADVYVSVPNESVRVQVVDSLGDLDLGLLDVRIVDNRGRDIAPKYVTFADVYGRGYDLLLFLHTKKSLTADFGDAWRDQLFRSLAGSPPVVNGIIRMFESDAALGIVAPRHHELIGSTTGWDGNYPEAKRLGRRTGLPVQRWAPPDFASGSMFWARPEALVDLTGLRLQIEDFPPERGQVGVTIMHALERMVFVAAEHAGYHSVMVADPGSSPASTSSASGPEHHGHPQASHRPPPHLFAAAALLTGMRLMKKGAVRLHPVVQRIAARRLGSAR